jgi:hypothetical protein
VEILGFEEIFVGNLDFWKILRPEENFEIWWIFERNLIFKKNSEFWEEI